MNELADYALEVAQASAIGPGREHNEDSCGSFADGDICTLVGVADGVSSSPGGEVASQMAIEIVARAFREEAPALAAGQRLYRAVQQANIEIYDRSIAVPELRGMCTTLTFGVVDRGELTAVHVGDSRLYLVRDGEVTQLTQDHTVAAGKARIGLMSKERALQDAERCILTRSMGRELIVARDRLTRRLAQGDVLVLVQRRALHGGGRRRAGSARRRARRRKRLPRAAPGGQGARGLRRRDRRRAARGRPDARASTGTAERDRGGAAPGAEDLAVGLRDVGDVLEEVGACRSREAMRL
jgi:protein phosphatase